MFHADLVAPGLRQNQLSAGDSTVGDRLVLSAGDRLVLSAGDRPVLSTVLPDFCKWLHNGTALSSL
jgi:hypothetical protein